MEVELLSWKEIPLSWYHVVNRMYVNRKRETTWWTHSTPAQGALQHIAKHEGHCDTVYIYLSVKPRGTLVI